jgi:hypothetical protein
MKDIAILPALNLESVGGNSALKSKPTNSKGASFQQIFASVNGSPDRELPTELSVEKPQSEPVEHDNTELPLPLANLAADQTLNPVLIAQMMAGLQTNLNTDVVIDNNHEEQLVTQPEVRLAAITKPENRPFVLETVTPNNISAEILPNFEAESIVFGDEAAQGLFLSQAEPKKSMELAVENPQPSLANVQENKPAKGMSDVFPVKLDVVKVKPLSVQLTQPLQPNLLNLINHNQLVSNESELNPDSLEQPVIGQVATNGNVLSNEVKQSAITKGDLKGSDDKTVFDLLVDQLTTDAGSEELNGNLKLLEPEIPFEEVDLKNLVSKVDNITLPELNQRQVTNLISPTKENDGELPVSKSELFTQIVEKAKVMVSQGNSEMEISLKPDNLGKLQLKISLENHLVTAKFVAESDQVKQILESNLVQLRNSLQEQGIQVENLMVSVGQDGNGAESFQQHFADQSKNFELQRIKLNNNTIEEIFETGVEKQRMLSYSKIDLIA